MIVCDECRNVDAKCFDCDLILEKQEKISTKRKNRREVVRIHIALCEKCITKVITKLRRLASPCETPSISTPKLADSTDPLS